MLSYVVLAASTLPPDTDERLLRAGGRGLFFEPSSQIVRRNETGTIALAGWERRVGPIPDGAHWIDSPAGLLALSGYAVPGDGWNGGSEWLESLSHRMPGCGPEVVDELWGTFTMLWLPNDRTGFAATDPLGTSVLYIAERGGLAAISNRAALAAYAIVRADEEPERDLAGPMWYVAFDTAVGGATGFVDVRAVPSFEAVTFAPTGVVGRVLLAPLAPRQDETVESLIDSTWAELRAHVRVLPSVGATRVGLTGGRDSRLLLAAAAAEGIADQLTYFTMAAFPGDADPTVATLLADEFELRHEIVTAGAATRDSDWFEESMRVHAFKSSGMFPGTALRGEMTAPRYNTVSGSFGEHLHDFFSGRPVPQSLDEALAVLVGRQTAAPMGLCSAEVLADHRQRLRAALVEIQQRDVAAEDLLYHFRLEHRVHRWFSAQVEMSGLRPSVHPMYSVAGVRAALAIGCAERLRERLHFELIRRGSEILARMPFEKYGWPSPLYESIPGGQDIYGCAPIIGPTTPKGLRGLLWHNHRTVYERYLLDDSANPIQSVLDRAKVESVLRGSEELPPPVLRQLNNALAAAIWLGRHEGTHRIPLDHTSLAAV